MQKLDASVKISSIVRSTAAIRGKSQIMILEREKSIQFYAGMRDIEREEQRKKENWFDAFKS